jgi:hypothetical protein
VDLPNARSPGQGRSETVVTAKPSTSGTFEPTMLDSHPPVGLEMSIATAAGTRKAPPGSPTPLLSVLWHRRAIERLVQQLPLEGPPPEPRSSDKAAGAATLSGDA